ncbi:hypothetical protein OEA41_001330 [Lepraria neglecta]|uniref:Uncharacterized protein n=1 Tax=Lepraria neglecta TaxID=209136 RepID=A0AAD9ZAK1_9LECA|nr:hypothetical protein OEA41_001330 [Lepraria neglecta]
MSFSENEINTMSAEIQHVSSTKELLARPALQVMLDLINPSFNISPVELLRQYLARVKAAEGLVKITAGDTTIPQMVEVFGLTFDILSMDAQWTLAEDSILEEPKILRRNLNDLRDAFYEDQSEATCRIAIDIILIQCRKYLRLKYKAETASLATPSTPLKGALNAPTETPKKSIKLYPESTISVEIPNRSIPNSRFLVSGRADWALGYSSKDEDGALLVAVEAKQRSEFGAGESQLIAYLAILRENRRKAGKTDIITQGFYSDGTRFGFVCIKDDGTIVQSPTWDTHAGGGLGMVFSFIVAMLETALKSTPTASPTKPGVLQDKEIHHFDDEVWSKVYKSMKESLVVDDGDDNMDDVIDLSRVF